MATIPAGSLVFTGYGDSGGMRYLSPAGVLYGQPPNDPAPGAGTSAIRTLVGSNALAIIGGNTPNFSSTGTGTFNSSGSFRAQYSHGGGSTYAGFGGGRDDNGYFYSCKSSGSDLRIFQYDVDATLTDSWTVAMGFTIGSVQAMGVNGAGTIAYVNLRKFSGATAAEIYAIDLAGAGSSLGVFASDATSTSLQGQTCVIGLTNGDVIIAWRHANNVKRYNAAGTLQATYALPGSLNPMALAYGATPTTTFWCGAYSSATTFSTTTVYEVRISDGTILNQFDPEDGSFEFDSSFTVLGAAMSATTPTTPTTTFVNSVACCGDTVTPGAGSATGPVLPGIGWTPQCTGGGAVESATDLTDAQNWDTISEREADVWFELELAKYPATEGTTTYRWSKTPFADAGAFKEGRLLSFGKVKRVASTVDGDPTVGGFSVVVDDSDGLIRTLLEQDTTSEHFLNREGGLYVLSPAGRAAGVTPRQLGRGWVSNVQTPKGRIARIDVADIVGSQYSGYNLDKTIPTVLLDDIAVAGQLVDALKGKVLPIYAGELSDDGAVDVNGDPAARGLVPAFDIGAIDITDPDNTDAPVSTAPTPPVITASSVTGATGQETRCYGATLITPYGESLMSNIVTCNGASVRNVSNYNEISGTFDGGVGDVNKVRIWYGPTADNMVGWLDEANYNGSGIFGYFDGAAAWPTATRDEIDTVKSMDAPATPPDNNWHIMAVCLGYGYEFLNFYGSNLADGTSPVRAEVDAGLHGVQIIGPDDPEWPWSTPYIERNGIRFTGYLSVGPLFNHHRDGVITQAVNICGPHDSTGLLIDQAFRQLLWLLNEHVAKNGGTGYKTGDYWPLEAYANGDALFQTTKFEDAQDASGDYLGTALGYLGMMALTEPITVREFVRRFCRTFGCRLAHNHFGQVFPFLVDAPADATAGRALREHIEIVDIGDPELAHDEILNRQVYSYHVDPEGGENPYRNAGLIAEDLTSIAAHTPGGVSGGADRRGVKQGDDREMAYTNDDATADDVIARELARRARRPRYLPVTVDLMGLEQEIGDQVRVTHREGLGSGGDVLMASMVLAHETDADSLNVTLTVQDLRTLPSAAFELMRADDDGALLVADDDGAVLVAD